MTLNEVFYNWRKRNELTQVQACYKLGVCRATYIKFEKGEDDISAALKNKFYLYYLTHQTEFADLINVDYITLDSKILYMAQKQSEELWQVVNAVSYPNGNKLIFREFDYGTMEVF